MCHGDGKQGTGAENGPWVPNVMQNAMVGARDVLRLMILV